MLIKRLMDGARQNRLIGSFVVVFCLMMGICAPVAFAQITIDSLVSGAVDTKDPKYRDLTDAVVLLQRGNAQACLAMLRSAKEKHAELPPGEVMFAHLCFASGNMKPGRDLLQIAAVRFEGDPEVWNMLADLQLREEHFAEAELLFEQALAKAKAFSGNKKRKSQQLTNALAGAAMANERRGLWADAEPHLVAWKEAAPQSSDVYSRLAAVYINTERYEEALTILEELRELDPKQLPAEVVLGNTYDRLNKPEQAKASLMEALEKYPEDFETQIAVARWGLNSGDLELALACAERAATLKEDSPVPDLIVAQADYLNGDFEEAEASFLAIYQEHPSSEDAQNGLALSILAQEDSPKYKRARQYAEVIAKSNNDLRTSRGRHAASLLAWALYRNEAYAEAERLMANVLASGSISAEDAYFAAVIFTHQGRIDTAQNILNFSLSNMQFFAHRDAAEELLQDLNQGLPNPTE